MNTHVGRLDADDRAATDLAADNRTAALGETASPEPGRRTARQQKTKLDGVSSSLRMVYQNAVDESVPDMMLDLLKQLD